LDEGGQRNSIKILKKRGKNGKGLMFFPLARLSTKVILI